MATNYPTGITTPATVVWGGDGAQAVDVPVSTIGQAVMNAASQAAARAAVGAAAPGANADITHLTAILDATFTAEAAPATPAAGKGILYLVNDNGFLRPIIKLPDASVMDLDQDTVFVVCNTSASSIPAGSAIYASGVDPTSGKLIIALAKADSASTAYCLGILIDTLAAGNVTTTFGRVCTIGRATGFDTTGLSAGQRIYLSASVAGALTQTAPTAPGQFQVSLGVVRTSANPGIVEVRATTPVPTPATLPQPVRTTLTDAATIAVDASLSDNFVVTLGGNRTIAAPTNLVAGMGFLIEIVQDGTGSRTLAFNAIYKFAAASPSLVSTAAGSKDLLACYYDGTSLLCFLTLAYA